MRLCNRLDLQPVKLPCTQAHLILIDAASNTALVGLPDRSLKPCARAFASPWSLSLQTERKRPGGPAGSDSSACGAIGDVPSGNRNSHEMVSCANCGNSQCSHTNAPNNCPNGEEVTVTEPVEVSQVEYTFKPHKKAPPHPIRVAKSIDVISRIVFPLGFFIFLFYFFATYRGFSP
ncbi:putative glycine receptor subunit alpha-4-like 7 [Homarus americanus]|uniref:Putative glycine receptor subunit alpha-4-like 7 n=1 Tax=Homarus americanus TaxID=6706 RepID=A0A8J5N8K0_HOMAM|nr:putative glycine receptor subunit alpha-4-like 7 [Homarus americanus]